MTLSALAVAFGSTATMATEPDEGPIAALVPGSSTSYVSWPPEYEEYIGEWLGPDDAVSVSREASRIELVLPDEVLDLPLLRGARVIVQAVDGARLVELMRWAVWGEDAFASGRIGFDLSCCLFRRAESVGVPNLTALRVTVENTDVRPWALYLAIDIVLVESTSTDPAVVVLGDPPAMLHDYTFLGSDVLASRRGQIALSAWPGLFGPDAPQPMTVALFTGDWGDSTDLTRTMTIADDGSVLTVTLPDDVAKYSWLKVTAGSDAGDRYTVYAALIAPPLTSVEAYVKAVYNDLFGRDPDPAGLYGWTYALTHGAPYSAVADSITASAEFRAGLITASYWAYLRRGPDPAGLAGWLRAMNQGMHIQQMEAGFLASQEYYDVRGGGTDHGWITSLYLDVLGRWPSGQELYAWFPVIRSAGRQSIAYGFLYSTEKLATDVEGYYQWLLRRGLDPVGRNGWVKAIQSGVRVEVIIAGIIASQEYRNNVPVG